MQQKATASVILAGALWGGIGLFVKNLNAAGFTPIEIALIRMIVAALVMTAATLLRSPGQLKIAIRDLWMFIGTGIVSVTLFNTCYFSTIVNSEASVAVVLLYTSPIFIMLFSALLFRERITGRKLAALAMTFVGCVLVAGLAGGSLTIAPAVLLTGIGSGLFYGLYTIFGRFALAKYDSATVTTYTFLFGLVGTLPIGNFPGIAARVAARPSLLLWCLGVGIFCTVLPYFFYTWGLQRMESGKAAILVAVEPLVGAVIGMTLFHESREAGKLVGIVLILSAIVLLNLPEKEVTR